VQLGHQRRDVHKQLLCPCLVFDGLFFISMTGQYAGAQVAAVIRIVVSLPRKLGLVRLQVLDVGRQIASTLAQGFRFADVEGNELVTLTLAHAVD
jgi:hypothetical protein